MGGSGSCVSREDSKPASCCGSRSREDGTVSDCASQHHDEEHHEQLRIAEERERLLSFVEEDGGDIQGARSRIGRFYSIDEMAELEAFRLSFREPPPMLSHAHSLIGIGCGPWGIGEEKGGSQNAWDDVAASNYKVRGPNYLSDRQKQVSEPSLGELVLMDMFMSTKDIANVAACEEAKTVQRLRRAGEKRKLLVLNFRLVPLHAIAVWAFPDSPEDCPSGKLLERFFAEMEPAERNKRLKVIPRVLKGPWFVRKLLGENSAAILGKGIPVSYFHGDNSIEVSVSITSSAAAQRVSRAMLRAGSALEVELGLVVEGKTDQELPERLLGGFRVAHADLTNLRSIEASEEAARAAPAPAASANAKGAKLQRPAFLPAC